MLFIGENPLESAQPYGALQCHDRVFYRLLVHVAIGLIARGRSHADCGK